MGRKRDEKKWHFVQCLLRDLPGASDRAIASMCQMVDGSCSPTFVGQVRRAMESEGTLPVVTAREGLDGRKRGRTQEEKEQLRQDKERQPRRGRGRPRHGELTKRQIRKEGRKLIWEMIREEQRIDNPLPLIDDFADQTSEKSRHGKGRVNRKAHKEDDE